MSKRMGRPITMKYPFGDLARALGSVEQLADAVGVTRATINRWATGMSPPSEPARRLLNDLLTKHNLPTIPPSKERDP